MSQRGRITTTSEVGLHEFAHSFTLQIIFAVIHLGDMCLKLSLQLVLVHSVLKHFDGVLHEIGLMLDIFV